MAGLDQSCYVHGTFELNSTQAVLLQFVLFETHVTDCRSFLLLGDVINLGDRQLTVLHMPGHSRGSISLHDRENKLLFSGDVVYDGSMIDWLPYSRVSDYIGSCERLVGLVDSEQVTDVQTNWSI